MTGKGQSDSRQRRRDFVRSMTLGTAGVAVGARVSQGQDKKAEHTPATAPVPRSEVDARMDVVLARFGKHRKLDAAAQASIRSDVGRIVELAERLRKLPVDNGEGPFPVFIPYRDPLAG